MDKKKNNEQETEIQFSGLERTFTIINKKKKPELEEIIFLLKELKNIFNYYWKYIEFQVRNKTKLQLSENNLKKIFETPFLWKKRDQDFLFLLEKEDSSKKIKYSEKEDTLNICLEAKKEKLTLWKRPVFKLKKILKSLGISSNIWLHYFSKNKCEEHNNLHQDLEKFLVKEHIFLLNEEEKTLFLNTKFSSEKLFEFGIHTNFSTLDGISTAEDYLLEAEKKDYKALIVSDHFNVQSFPSFAELLKKKKKESK